MVSELTVYILYVLLLVRRSNVDKSAISLQNISTLMSFSFLPVEHCHNSDPFSITGENMFIFEIIHQVDRNSVLFAH